MLINSIAKSFAKKRVTSITKFKENPLKIQRATLSRLLKKNKSTTYGTQYNFQKIDSWRDYQEAVPIVTYEDLESFIQRVIKGEKQVLCSEPVHWFAKSSGTTNAKSKFIPVNDEVLKKTHFRGGTDTLALYWKQYPASKLFTGKILTLGGSHEVNQLNPSVRYGDLSAVMLQRAPSWTSLVKAPSKRIALESDFEKKVQAIATHCSKQNITGFAGVPSWFLVLLKQVLKHHHIERVEELWENIELFIHGGVHFSPYKKAYEAIIQRPNMCYMNTYNASEGFFAIQDRYPANDMLLMLDYEIYYEFIPLSELHNEHPNAYTLEQVRIGENYAMVITTSAGLWRYLIGDTITFTSLDPFRIRITGRTKHYINAFGEELIIDNAEKSLEEACQQTDAVIKEYTAGPVFMSEKSRGKHEWIIEFEKPPQDIEQFTTLLDSELQKVNSDYEAKRYKDITLDQLQLNIAPVGTFYSWMEKRGKLGGQNKVPRLCNDRTYLDSMLTFLKQ